MDEEDDYRDDDHVRAVAVRSARSVRIKATWAAWDAISGHLLTILSATARLENVNPDETDEPLRSRMHDECDRWASQVEESTR
ncbi:hypothetical protein QF026_001529 [Streptomyces aurantiacus]|uniref:hypothetical protein n=1 Tax=Streptomyces aurantiacus TaxID=47760 RepID=UPI00278CF2CD|nr:hypothetical protein [Streptomyces aurantiacus]MDQ0773063.1 hypothetical protein [Streptomyces aurantiacus]